MLPVNLRLDSKEIPFVAKKGKRYFGEFLDVQVYRDSKTLTPKFAISISIKVDKRATVRNRIKRIIREAIRLNSKDFKAGKYLILVKKPELAKKKTQEVEEIFRRFIGNT